MTPKLPDSIRSSLALNLALAVALSGCGAMMKRPAPPPPSSAAQQRMDALSAAYRRTLVQGALIGAASGAAIGAVASNSKDRARNALIGAGAGLIAGLIAGAIVGEQQKKYAGTEAELNELITSSRQSNAILDQLVKDMETVVSEDNARIAEIESQLQQGQIDQAEAQRRLGRVNQDRQQMQATIETARKRKVELEKASQAAASGTAGSGAATTATRTQLDDEIQRMDKLIERAQAAYDGLKPSPVG